MHDVAHPKKGKWLILCLKSWAIQLKKKPECTVSRALTNDDVHDHDQCKALQAIQVQDPKEFESINLALLCIYWPN